jgi:LPS sulfotransferase NodH
MLLTALRKGLKNFYNQEELDQPPYDGETKSYLICSMQRVGSNVLCELLREAGYGVPHEYFHYKVHIPVFCHRLGLLRLGNDLASLDLNNYLKNIKKIRTTPNGYFGVKAHFNHFFYINENVDINDTFPGLRYIFMYRENELAQAVSMVIAAQSRQWTSDQASVGKLTYDAALIRRGLKIIRTVKKQWKDYFQAQNIVPYEVSYERLLSHTQEEFDRIIEFIGGENSMDVNLNNLRIKKQAGEINQQWINKFMNE